jgi:methylated-DNA-[protein]-cysteine S-methyltransferase
MVASDYGLRFLAFGGEEALTTKQRVAKEDKTHTILKTCEIQLAEYFQGKRKAFTVPLELEGTDFQKKVWKALKEIPFGQTESYLHQATRIKMPKAVRAVAAANGKNPIAIIVPCHRVIASTGHLHGYASGLEIKAKLLSVEGLTVEKNKLKEKN